MSAFFELSHQTESVMKDSAALADKLGFETAAQTIREQIDAFRKKELMVVVAGEARRGKSSLLNALLNEKTPLFPVDVNVCTNVVTVVRYGETETIEAYIEDPKVKNGCRVKKLSREQIPDYVSEKGNPNNYKQVKMLSAYIPNDLLREGVVFVDTPGVGSLNIEHAETTYGFLPNADVLLFVSDADSGLTESELNFLKRGYQYCKSILFPLTKKDLNADYAAILEDNQTKISKRLNIPPDEVQVIPVSSTAKQRYLKSGNQTMLSNSNYTALENTIWSTIAQRRGEVLLMPFLMAAKGELFKLMDSVAAQYQVLSAGQNVAQELMEELDRKTSALGELQDKGAEWRSQLQLFFTVLQNDASKEQQRIAAEARVLVDDRYRSMETRICTEQNYTQVVCEVNDLIGRGIIDIRERIARQIEDKSAELQDQIDLGFSVNEELLDKIGFTPEPNPPVAFPPKKTMDTAIKWGRNIGMNSMGAGTIGSILGGFIGLCFGGPAGLVLGAQVGGGIGGLAGGAKGCIHALTQYDQLDVNAVIKALNQHIANAMSGVSANISNTVAELRVTLSASFEQQLKKQAKELRDNASQIQKNISLTANELPKKRAALESQNTELRKELAQYEVLERAVGELGGENSIHANQSETDSAHCTPAESEQKTSADEISYGFL